MKKTVFLALMACGLVTSCFVGNSMSQENDLVKTHFIKDGKFTMDGKVYRVRKLKFIPKTMNEEELNAEIARLQKQLTEKKAEKKLWQANKILREIVKEYPESRAAKKANMMLKTRIGIE